MPVRTPTTRQILEIASMSGATFTLDRARREQAANCSKIIGLPIGTVPVGQHFEETTWIRLARASDTSGG